MLTDALVKAINQANAFFLNADLPFDGFLFAGLVRYHLRLILSAQKYVVVDEAEVSVESERVLNIGIQLTHNGVRIKVRKGKRGEVPVADTNAQVAWYCQQLPLNLDGPCEVATDPNVIFVWESRSDDEIRKMQSIDDALNGRATVMLPQELRSLEMFCTHSAMRGRKLSDSDIYWSKDIEIHKKVPAISAHPAASSARQELPFGLPTGETGNNPIE